jgi:hypothetical protein
MKKVLMFFIVALFAGLGQARDLPPITTLEALKNYLEQQRGQQQRDQIGNYSWSYSSRSVKNGTYEERWEMITRQGQSINFSGSRYSMQNFSSHRDGILSSEDMEKLYMILFEKYLDHLNKNK